MTNLTTRDLTPEHTARHIDSDIHPEVRAAYRYVDSVVDTADFVGVGPAWHGWALREAFLAGCSHARSCLAQSESKMPTDEELWEVYDKKGGNPYDWAWVRDYARAVLARYGGRTPVPIPLSERYPNLRPDGDDFSKDGCLWWYSPRLKWQWASRDAIDCIPYPTHWLPHWALPVPGQDAP